MWPPRGQIHPPALKWNHACFIFPNPYLHHLLPQRRTQYYNTTKKHNILTYYGLLSFKVTLSPMLINRKLTFQTWMPSISNILQFLFKGTLFIAFFCHWYRSDYGGSYILHCQPCKSTLLCKQISCCCRSSFAGSQTSCTCTSSAYSIKLKLVPMLFWSAVEQEAPHPLSIHDPPVIQDPA